MLANIFPNEVHEMCYSYFTKDLQKAMNLQLKHLELINNLFIETNPIPVKEAMNYLKFNVGELRLPLSNMSIFNYEVLKKSIDKFKKPLNIPIALLPPPTQATTASGILPVSFII